MGTISREVRAAKVGQRMRLQMSLASVHVLPLGDSPEQ